MVNSPVWSNRGQGSPHRVPPSASASHRREKSAGRPTMRRVSLLLGFAVLALGIGSMPRHLQSRTATSSDFVHFESAQVHPAVLTPSGDRLLVGNTPDARLLVFDVTASLP